MLSNWVIDEKTHAGHTIKLKFASYSHELTIEISGPRASSIDHRDDAVNNSKTVKVRSKIPFKSPSPKKIEDVAYDQWKDAINRIDAAIAEYAKEHRGEYK